MTPIFLRSSPLIVGAVVILVATTGILYFRSIYLCTKEAELNALLLVSFVQEQITEIRNPMWFTHQPENRIGDLTDDKYIPIVAGSDSCNRFSLRKCVELQVDDKIQRTPAIFKRLNQLIDDPCKHLVGYSEKDNAAYGQINKGVLASYFECHATHRQERLVIISLVRELDQTPIPISVSGDARRYQSSPREVVSQSMKIIK